MAKIRLTKQYEFEMAHALYNYDGRCRNIHGHSYKLYVTIIGNTIQNSDHPKNGMVMDFGQLKRIVQDEIVDELDHSLVINKKEGYNKLGDWGKMYQRFHTVDFQPTSENLVVYIADKIKQKLPAGIELYSLRLNETSSSYAEWYAADNE